MPNYFSADFICPYCGTRFTELIERELKDEAHRVTCIGCYAEPIIERSLGAPLVAKESLPDGQRRKNNADYQRMRDAVKLERQAYNKPPDSKERKELFAAADKLKKGQLPT